MLSIAEERIEGEVPLWVHPEWSERFPWLVQGTTGAGASEDPFDLGLFGSEPVGRVLERWRALRGSTGMREAVHARQVHGAEVRSHRATGAEGLRVLEDFDGHITGDAGVLLTVSVADCVPVSIVSARPRLVALVHAGWRGVAGGILEEALASLRAKGAGEVRVHLGPAICGRCYEVGPEVHAAVRPADPPPAGPALLDIREALAERAMARGVPEEGCTCSTHCTRCGSGAFFSHRGGSPRRQMGILGLRG